MKGYYRGLYAESVAYIKEKVAIRLELQTMLRRNLYAPCADALKEMIDNADRAIKNDIKAHNDKFRDVLNLRKVKAYLLDDKIPTAVAKEMAVEIDATGYVFSGYEADFMRAIMDTLHQSLTIKQSRVLTGIYEKAIGLYETRTAITRSHGPMDEGRTVTEAEAKEETCAV